ncbi:MAG TPA: helix-turn-helix transcriptional regulator, partial [Pseudonocardiaceae bacterium]|nr:helix-turn-helix transcriptional regulator [Pseudonocardiaceae bacterium]
MVRPNPVTAQRRLRAELRRLREQAGLTQKQVADALEWSASKVIRIETGAVGVSKTDLKALLDLYGLADQSQIDQLIQTSRDTREQAWWDDYRSTYPPLFITFIGLEASASLLRQYQALLVPGLLQTEEYAREAISGYTSDQDRIDEGVRVRMRRQRSLEPSAGLTAFFVLDEAVIRRVIGGRAVMADQLSRLKELNRQPNISIQVVTFDKGANVGMKSSFTVFEFPTGDQDHAVYLEQSY